MEFEAFQELPSSEIAQLMRAANSCVCAFPANGTRRWFWLEHSAQEDYLEVLITRQIEVTQLLFGHGLNTILAPIFTPVMEQRGNDYMRVMIEGLEHLVNHPVLLQFYRDMQVRVHFYGDYRHWFKGTSHAYVLDLFAHLAKHTSANNRHRLFFGVCANDAVETISQLCVHHYQQYGRAPDKRTLIGMYYGEYVEPVNLFITSGKFNVFDMPLLATGNEDLYFTVSPSLYLTQRQLRTILYDHLYIRRAPRPAYASLSPEMWDRMRAFYQTHMETTLGVGRLQDGIWHPYLP
jgi:tuberculosinol/isotuberculosinol synthase